MTLCDMRHMHSGFAFLWRPYETDYGVERDVETEQEIEAEKADKWQEQKGDEE